MMMQYNRSKTAEQIRKEFGITADELSDIVARLRQSGVKVPSYYDYLKSKDGEVKWIKRNGKDRSGQPYLFIQAQIRRDGKFVYISKAEARKIELDQLNQRLSCQDQEDTPAVRQC